MIRPIFAVLEGDGSDGDRALAPDFPGTGGVEDTLKEARRSRLEGTGYLLEKATGVSRYLNAPCRTIDFAEFDPEPTGHSVLQWISVEIPVAVQAAAAA